MKVKIEKLGINGEGIGKISNKVCFVDFALPGEKVDIDIIQEKSKYCVGKINNIVDVSKDRVQPTCPYFYKCGGCDLQHMSSTMQNKFKVQKIAENLQKIGHINCDISDIVSFDEFNYRNKMVFVFSENEKNFSLAMKMPKSDTMIPIDNCMIASEDINKVIKSVNWFLNEKGFEDFSMLKYLVVRSVNSQVLITLVVSKNILPKNFYEYLCNDLKGYNIGLSLVLSDRGKDIMSGKYSHLYGIKAIELNDNDIIYSVDNRGFLQVNNKIKQALYQDVLSEISENDFVIDAYSGAGLLTSIISKKCKSSIGIEINSSASNSAKKLKEINNLNNIDFVCGDVKNELNKHLIKDCVLVLDPPRSGCDKEVIKSILNAKVCPKKIIYISCDTATLSRDLSALVSKYKITRITPYNMFPNTKHIETLVCLQRQE